MNKIVVLAILCIVTLILFGYAIWLLSQEFLAQIKGNRIWGTTIFVITTALFTTYFTALLCKKLKLLGIVEQVGSADAWIDFSGSCLGAVITMLALYFTLKDNKKISMQGQINAIKPYLSCKIINMDESNIEIIIDNCIENYGTIECEMINLSDNIANKITIKEQYTSIPKNNSFEIVDDLLEEYGISIYTVSINDGTFLAPQEKYKWRVNFGIELNEDGTYKWDDAAFSFKYSIIFQYEDVSELAAYLHKFEFEININIDTNNNLHFFLWNISNSMSPLDKIIKEP